MTLIQGILEVIKYCSVYHQIFCSLYREVLFYAISFRMISLLCELKIYTAF